MKICRITDEYRPMLGAVGYLYYFENAGRFYIEIPDGLSFNDAPLILDQYIKKGINYVDSEWSMHWVCNRIIPRDRQNIGQILRDAGLAEYDEYKLLILTDGRCAQDDCMIEQITENELPDAIRERGKQRIQSVTPLNDRRLLVFFHDKTSVMCKLTDLVGRDRRFKPVLSDNHVFEKVRVNAGGYSIGWGETIEIADYVIRKIGTPLPMNLDDMRLFIDREVCDTAETARRLNCTRQNIDDLVRRGRLTPVKSGARSKFFFRNEVEERLW